MERVSSIHWQRYTILLIIGNIESPTIKLHLNSPIFLFFLLWLYCAISEPMPLFPEPVGNRFPVLLSSSACFHRQGKTLSLALKFSLCCSERILPLYFRASFLPKRLSVIFLENPSMAQNFSMHSISLKLWICVLCCFCKFLMFIFRLENSFYHFSLGYSKCSCL